MRFGSMHRRGFVLAAGLSLLVTAAPATAVAQVDETLEPVDVMHYFSKEFGGDTFEGLLGQYIAETGREVRLSLVPHEAYKTVILTQLAGGNPPDFYTEWAGARGQQRVDAGVVATIDDMWAANGLDDAFPQGIIDSAATYNGQLHALPLNYHVAAMWYSPQMLEEAGVEVPITDWEGLKDACTKITDAGYIPFSLGSKDRWPAQFWFDYILLRTAGPEYRAELMAGEASYTDPEVVRTMELWGELIAAGCFNEDANAKTYGEAADMIARDEAAMNLMGTWITGYWTNNNPLEPVTDYDFFPFPAIDLPPESAVVGPVDSVAVSVGAANPEGAKDLMAFFARPDIQAAWAAGQGALPVHVEAEAPENPTMVKGLELANTAETYNFNYDLATPPAPSEVGLDMFQEFIQNPDDIQGILERTQAAMEVAFESQ